MVRYRISVVGASDGQFLVNHYYKKPDIRVDDIGQVIDWVTKMDLPILEAEPVYCYLNSQDKAMIEGARLGIIRRESALATKT